MALHFYFGGSGSGKSHAVFRHMIDASIEEPDSRFLILVPEQSTMETQRQIVRLHPRGGILNIDVLSMTRLAHRIFAEVGYRKEEMLEEIGKTFLLEKVALEEKKRLPWYGEMLPKPEYLSDMKAMISELMLYDISPEDLDRITGEGEDGRDALPEKSALAGKLRDIALIYRSFRKKLEGSYMTAEEIPERLGLLAEKSEMLRDATVVLDGFTGFTPLQMRLIGRMLPVVRDLYVTVTVDARQNPFAPCRESDLFAMSCETVRALMRTAREASCPVEKPVFIEPCDKSRHGASPALQALEANLFRKKAQPFQGKDIRDIRYISCASPREEVECAALMICRMVREEGYRYRDFAVITGDLGTYGRYVRQAFPESGIPFFVDEKRALLQNPFMEYLRAALEAVTEQYAYEPMFRMLKSGMTDFDRDEIHHLENYVIATGVRGKKRWREPFLRTYKGEDAGELPRLNALREQICALLDPLADVFSSRKSTIRDMTAAVYEFCVRSRAEEKIRAKQACFEETGNGGLAREYAQVWPYVVSFLDKLVAVLGSERVPMRDMRALIEAGFGEARVAIIPPGHDQVLIGDMERSRLAGIRVLFFVGVNEGLIPKAPDYRGALTEADRDELFARGISLKPTSRQQMYIDRFYLYLTLTRPSDRLILTSCAANASGEEMRPSYLIGAIRHLFPDLRTEEAPSSLRDRVEREAAGPALLLPGLMEIDTAMPEPDYLQLFSYYLHHPDYESRMRLMLSAAGSRKEADQISRAAAQALYGKELRNSASRLEQFCRCRYAHFLRYGLKLKERQEYLFTGLDMGSLMHRSLELFDYETKEAGLSWADLINDADTRNRIADDCVLKAVAEYGSAVLEDNARDRYQVGRMQRLMRETAWTQSAFLAAGDFHPSGAETAFRSTEDLDAFQVELSDGCRMVLTGRIDRIDTCEDGDASYVRITDYKTGNVSFDLAGIYYGLQLQLALYMNAAVEMLAKEGNRPVPAGMFYYRIQDPVLDYQDHEGDDALGRRRLKKMRVSGAVLADAAVLPRFDRTLEAGKTSDVVPVELKKDGSPSSRSSLLSEEAFRTIGRYVRRIVKRSAQAIMDGSAEINPFRYKQETACDFCPFRPVCGFDRRIGGYGYRQLPSLDGDEALRKMEEEEEA